MDGKIKLVEGTWDETCTTELDLGQNEIRWPEVSQILQHTEQRMLVTMIVSGATKGSQTAKYNSEIKTKIGTIPKGKLIGNNAYRYRLMGRIQRASVILKQTGVASGIRFQLIMKDNYLTPGMNAYFHGEMFVARVATAPTGSAGNYVYTFESIDGTVFDWNTHVAPQAGDKTCFGGFNTSGEKSIRGYSRAHYPDLYINHTTIQRKSTAISGSAESTVLWVKYKGASGWIFEKLRQFRAQFQLEDEHAKIWGKSNMKDPVTGKLLDSPRHIDAETGLGITQGDGIWEQIRGKNDSLTSGANGRPTIDDFTDMMTRLKEKAPTTEGNLWYAITGPEGMSNAQRVLQAEAVANGFHSNANSPGTGGAVGGPEQAYGYNWRRYNVDGNSVIFCEHPLFGDRQRWSETADDGQLIMGSSYIFINNYKLDSGRSNMEILGRGAYGNNRTSVMGSIKGMTGAINKLGGRVQTSVDADEYHVLKEDGIFVYDTSCCGILHRSAN